MEHSIYKKVIITIAIVALTSLVFSQSCLGFWDNMHLGSHMPYAKVNCGKTKGQWVVDFATGTSAIHLNGITGGIPVPVGRTSIKFQINFDGYNYIGDNSPFLKYLL